MKLGLSEKEFIFSLNPPPFFLTHYCPAAGFRAEPVLRPPPGPRGAGGGSGPAAAAARPRVRV